MTVTQRASLLLVCIAVADVLLASPVTSYGTYNGATQQARSADSTFAFKLPQTDGSDQSSDLATQVSSLSNSGRSYGVGAVPAYKDAIVYPDQIIRDSYGNIAKPYVPLSQEKTISSGSDVGHGVGFLTNVNKDQSHKTPTGTEKVPWVLPGYAGGILQANVPVATPQLDLLPPPLSSGNFHYPSSAPSIPSVPYSSSKPDGVPSSKDDNYNNEVAHGQGNSYDSTRQTVPQPGSPSISTQQQEPTNQAHLPTNNSLNPSGNYNSNHLAGSQPTTERSDYEKNYTHGKYHGGFGGAPGLLGDQKEIGYAVKGEPNPSSDSDVHPQSGSAHPTQSTGARPAVIDLSNNPTIIVPKPLPVGDSPGKYGGFPSNGNIANGQHTPSGDVYQPNDTPTNNGHIGSDPHTPNGANFPQINQDLLVPGLSGPSSDAKPPQSTYNPNLSSGTYAGPSGSNLGSLPPTHGPLSPNVPIAPVPKPSNYGGVPSSGGSQSLLPGSNSPNYNQNGTPNKSPTTSSVDSTLGKQNQPGYAAGGSSAPSHSSASDPTSKPTNYGGAPSAVGSQPPSHGSSAPNYPQNGVTNQSPTSGSVDSILGNQHQPGYAVSGSSAPSFAPVQNPSYGGSTSGVNGVQSTSHNQELLDSILGNQKQPGLAFGSAAPSHQASVPSAPIPSYGGPSAPVGVHHDAGLPGKDKYTGRFGGPPGGLTPHDHLGDATLHGPKPVDTNSYAGPNRKY